MAEFHFSPRPNRAGEINWRRWDEETFGLAKSADKPILLAISAVWCHWCHVMDETTYSDSTIIDYINAEFVPVRVDNDQRPDINARYNMGGWPTTVVLTPDGTTLTGGTYLPASNMLQMLREMSAFYRDNKPQIQERTAALRARKGSEESGPSGDLRESMIARILEEISDLYDEQYGGFGSEPKFPQTESLEFLLLEYRAGGDARLYEMVAKTMLGMSRGGMYDHVEGGFFRYSTTRDWSVPHFEKMTEDHAGLLRALATLVLAGDNPDFRSTLVSATKYLITTLRDPHSGLFGGSQDADEAYYEKPLAERRKLEPPYIDRTSYSTWTAALAGSFFSVALVLEDDSIASHALQALQTLHDRMRDADGLLYHFITPGGSPQVRGLLSDQAAYLRALLDAHEHCGEVRFLERAIELFEAIAKRFAHAQAGYYDHAGLLGELGNLSFKDRPLHDNALIADSLLRMHALTGEQRYREIAERTLRLYSKTYGKAGSFAASYARTIRRYLATPSTVHIIGDGLATAPFRETAHRLPDPLLSIRTISPSESATLATRGFSTDRLPVAYLCRASTCAAPVYEAAELRAAFESLTAKAR